MQNSKQLYAAVAQKWMIFMDRAKCTKVNLTEKDVKNMLGMYYQLLHQN